jgi:SWI/SNF-related matrix-associated actin-dependent regulator 1 of chromatin subfamily A
MELRQYQKVGIARIAKILEERKSAYLADEMGLGKSAQAIKVADQLNAINILVVCPASLRLNWAREIRKFSDRTHSINVVKTGKQINKPGSVVICSYDLASKLPLKQYDLLIVDEVHFCKNINRQRTKAVLGYLWGCAKYRLVMSGTPLPNGVIDGFTVFHRLDPKSFSSRFEYGHRYTYAKKNFWSGGWDFTGGRNLDELRRKVAHFMVRRRKVEVLHELPNKIIQTIPLDVRGASAFSLTPEQVEIIEKGEAAQLSVHCASQRRGLGILKCPAAIQYIKELMSEMHRLVVFCYHTDVAELLTLGLEKEGVLTLTGSTNTTKRDEIVQLFQGETPEKICLVAQVQAAGVGINLTAADTAVFVEPDWSPAVMSQAIDRLHRLGQENVVNIHFLSAEGSMDEDVFNSLRVKLSAINEAMQGEEFVIQ